MGYYLGLSRLGLCFDKIRNEGFKMITFVSWLGTATSILGSFLVAFQLFKIGYLCFLVGSFSWLFVSIIKRDKPLGVLNGTFFVANLIGIYNAFV
jgi:uncharacterized protein with PQ loop repeat